MPDTGYRGTTEADHRSLGKVEGTKRMPKILTAHRREDERERARLYLKSRLMLPTIPLGMVTLLAGYGDIVLMWVQDQLTPQALLGSTILFLCGAVWGWGHARYERYLLGTCPEYFARKQKLLEAQGVQADEAGPAGRWATSSWPAVRAGDVRRGDRVPGRDQPVLSGAPGGLCGDLSPLGRLF